MDVDEGEADVDMNEVFDSNPSFGIWPNRASVVNRVSMLGKV